MILRRLLAGAVALIGTVGLSAAIAPTSSGAHIAGKSGSGLTVITEPDDGFRSIDAFFSSPTRSLDLTIYELSDPKIESELAADAARGVAVRVLLDRNGEQSRNAAAFTYLSTHKVAVRWASGFRYTHEKAAVADGTRALVMTLNLTAKYYASTRDFAVLDPFAGDAAAIERTFVADWAGVKIAAPTGVDLLWSPGSEQALLSLIGSARHRLLVENEELADTYIVNALVAAARRGVEVEVVITKDSEWTSAVTELTAAGATVAQFKDSSARLYIHAKAIVVDPGTAAGRAFVGSENFSVTSLLYNRELGIVSGSGALVSRLASVIERDAAAGPAGGTLLHS